MLQQYSGLYRRLAAYMAELVLCCGTDGEVVGSDVIRYVCTAVISHRDPYYISSVTGETSNEDNLRKCPLTDSLTE